MPLTKATADYFKILASQSIKDYTRSLAHLPLSEFRKKSGDFKSLAEPEVLTDVKDSILLTPEGNQIKLRIYNGSNNTIKPTMVFFPGGGFIVDLSEVHYGPCSIMAKVSGYQVILVNTRLAPENPYPAGLNDAYFAAKYLFDHTQSFYIDPSKFVIAGDSSGSNFASLIVNKALDTHSMSIFHQILISPDVDLTRSLKKYSQYEQYDALLTPEVISYLYDHYMPDKSLRKNPEVSPYWSENLSNLPPTTLIIPEYDGLRSDGEGYYLKLLKSGNRVKKIIVKGLTHHSMILRRIFYDGENPAAIVGQRLRELND